MRTNDVKHTEKLLHPDQWHSQRIAAQVRSFRLRLFSQSFGNPRINSDCVPLYLAHQLLLGNGTWHSRQPSSPLAVHRGSDTVGFGGDAEDDLIFLDCQDGQTEVVLDHELFAHQQRMVLHGYPPCGLGELLPDLSQTVVSLDSVTFSPQTLPSYLWNGYTQVGKLQISAGGRG
jgi:hypothetical protein